MMTLRELGEFAGLGRATPPWPGNQVIPAAITLRSIAKNLSPVLQPAEQTSLRAMLGALPRLPPITLDAQLVGDVVGIAPYQPTVHVSQSQGAVLFTGVTVFRGLDGAHLDGQLDVHQYVPNLAADTRLDTQFATYGTPTQAYVLRITRAGVQSSGLVVLQTYLPFRVNLPPQPAPPGPPPAQPPSVPPVTTPVRYAKVAIVNCHSDHRAVDIRLRDVSAGEDFRAVQTLEAQYDANGFCPAYGAVPAEVSLIDGHLYEIVALDSEMPGCILNPGDVVDPHNASCWREHIVVNGGNNGQTFTVRIA